MLVAELYTGFSLVGELFLADLFTGRFFFVVEQDDLLIAELSTG